VYYTALMTERTRILTNNILDFYLLKQAQISERPQHKTSRNYIILLQTRDLAVT
jgi:hypothetical protein